ncbi:hypothetical protein TKK_0000946 [Trichogramma kaykai]|uniref:Large ribosomal subunit protein mL51 n=1 Tax=Trichogramma kaykai TaxID=54128 RepID=A0ABD2VWQ6_9HYME
MVNLSSFVKSTLKAWVPQITTVRFRYFADKKRCVRAHGYKEHIDQRGLLAHTDDAKPIIQMPIYRPVDSWSKKKAMFGQNDYIDIWTNGRIKLTTVMYKTPMWLKGIKRDDQEYRMLLRRRQMLQSGIYPVARPTKWKDMNKRIMYLYKFLNRKTKTGISYK